MSTAFVHPAASTAARSASAASNLETVLSTKKKGGGASAPASKKMQVKLLKHVAGTGQAGQIVMVSPAFYNNKLRPTKSAEVISDEQLQQEQEEAQEQEKATRQKAIELKDKLEDTTLEITRKAGPDGQLFGGIGAKVIMEELKVKLGNDVFLDSKSVKISQMTDSDGKKMRGDIKHTGEFGAVLSLIKDITAKFTISVKPES